MTSKGDASRRSVKQGLFGAFQRGRYAHSSLLSHALEQASYAAFSQISTFLRSHTAIRLPFGEPTEV